jgi:hypothetical protein
MVQQQGFYMLQFTPPPPPPPLFGSPTRAQIYIMSVLILFLSVYHSFLLTVHFMSFSFFILRLITIEDQVHIGTSSL